MFLMTHLVRYDYHTAFSFHLLLAATYDVQSLLVEEEGGGGGGGEGVLVRGELMSGSQAAGCLVVLQGPPTSPDIFRALQRTQSGDTVSTTIPLPPSNYTVYGYDLEENLLPNTMPAVILETQISSSFPGFLKANLCF